MLKMNPYAGVLNRASKRIEAANVAKKAAKKQAKK